MLKRRINIILLTVFLTFHENTKYLGFLSKLKWIQVNNNTSLLQLKVKSDFPYRLDDYGHVNGKYVSHGDVSILISIKISRLTHKHVNFPLIVSFGRIFLIDYIWSS